MRASQIEAWSVRVIEAVEQGQPNEDDRVELKADWPDVAKAARRIAGHANQMRGETILWLIGLDEKQGVTGASTTDPAVWWSRVAAQFSDVTPVAQFVNVAWNHTTIVAVALETDRAPYVVANPEYGSRAGVVVAWEVPWRSATQIRSATRSEVLRLLAPLEGVPDVSLMGGEVKLFKHSPDQTELGWYLDLWLIVEPKSDRWVVFPTEYCAAQFTVPGRVAQTSFERTYLSSLYYNAADGKRYAPNVNVTRNEIMIKGPAVLTLNGSSDGVVSATDIPIQDVEIAAKLWPTRNETPVEITATLKRHSGGEREEQANDPSGRGTVALATWRFGAYFGL